MVIKWSEFAKLNLRDFVSHSLMESKNVRNYVKSLVRYAEFLVEQNDLGKVLCYFNSSEIRQLIYKKHRILYYISNNEIRIVAVIHTSQDLKATLRLIERLFKE